MAENWHKRQALSLAAQLPDNASDANAVVRELQRLVDIRRCILRGLGAVKGFLRSSAIKRLTIPRLCTDRAQAGFYWNQPGREESVHGFRPARPRPLRRKKKLTPQTAALALYRAGAISFKRGSQAGRF
ncbi:MAG: hypothetical protein WCA28_34365 [Bradyrhizobium sp.]|jgi:hypothetical protein